MSALRADLEALVNRWATGGNGVTAEACDIISACSAELLRTLDGHPDEDAPAAEPVRYALVEQMGHRATVATVRETTFLGEPMLGVTDLKTGSEHLVSPKSLYEVTWLTEDQARARAKPWTAIALPAADPWGVAVSDTDDDEDEDEAARELAEEGNATAMSDAERDEYDRDGEAWLDAQDEADDAEEREIQRLEPDVDGDDYADERDDQ